MKRWLIFLFVLPVLAAAVVSVLAGVLFLAEELMDRSDASR